jgi:ATP-dependent Clp protease, protease subunit
MNLAPVVIQRDGRGERAVDIWSMLLQKRIVFMGTQVVDEIANLVIAQLLYLESEDPKTEINMYINSPGGSVTAGMAILDTMNHIKAPVSTTCVGLAASMGAVLLAAGEKGMRRALPHAKIMIHQPWGGYQGQASDIAIQAEEIIKTKKSLNGLLSDYSGQSIEQLEQDTDRDNYMSAAEAMEYGLIDEVATQSMPVVVSDRK